jgi:hypothetical protein
LTCRGHRFESSVGHHIPFQSTKEPDMRGKKPGSNARYEEAVRLLRDYYEARDQVNQLVGRAQVIVPGQPLAPSGPAMDRDWVERWEKATKRERKAEQAWRRFLGGEPGR